MRAKTRWLAIDMFLNPPTRSHLCVMPSHVHFSFFIFIFLFLVVAFNDLISIAPIASIASVFAFLFCFVFPFCVCV